MAELCQTHKKVLVLQNNNPENRRASLDSKGAIQKAGNIDIFNANVCRKKCVFLQTLNTELNFLNLKKSYLENINIIINNWCSNTLERA
ncbi:hypothetical protein D6B99_06385 [Arachidicoccus soli]|uniref:Uncharacterized protein n=1 Tax=Arachidicoccus soli TaxID=2341117 RepID=A0A386HNR3_9BACT|nr:hypothetical protein D6B99_06385 [Arachidicoccus soli]